MAAYGIGEMRWRESACGPCWAQVMQTASRQESQKWVRDCVGWSVQVRFIVQLSKTSVIIIMSFGMLYLY